MNKIPIYVVIMIEFPTMLYFSRLIVVVVIAKRERVINVETVRELSGRAIDFKGIII